MGETVPGIRRQGHILSSLGLWAASLQREGQNKHWREPGDPSLTFPGALKLNQILHLKVPAQRGD